MFVLIGSALIGAKGRVVVDTKAKEKKANEVKNKQPYKITRNERIEAARAKIQNPSWTVEEFRSQFRKTHY